MKIFLSFSSVDFQLVRPLMASLKEQGFQVWDYSEFKSEIPPGIKIDSYLKQQIDECDLFVALLSKNSTSLDSVGRFTRLEHDYAKQLGMHKTNQFIPIWSIETPPEKCIWEKDPLYSKLQSLRYLELSNNVQNLDNVVRSICQLVSVEYQPPFPDDPKLPILKKFEKETKHLLQNNAIHSELRGVLGQFTRMYQTGNWKKAGFLINYFLDTLIFHGICDFPPYYSQILSALLDFHSKDYENAENKFEKAIKINPNQPDAYGGLGLCSIEKGDYITAIKNFEKVFPISEDIDNDSYNLGLAYVLSKKEVPLNIEKHVLNIDLKNILERDLWKVIALQAHIHFKKNDFYLAVHKWEEIPEEDAPIFYLIDYIEYLFGSKSFSNAIVLIDSIPKRELIFEQTILLDYKAKALTHLGQVDEALQLRKNVLCKAPYVSQVQLLSMARLAEHLHERKTMEQALDNVLDFIKWGIPVTLENCDIVGWAHYLRGNIELAQYEFNRSKSEEWYGDR